MMPKLFDGVHYCSNCSIYPCTTQDFIEESSVCSSCPVEQYCCYAPLLPLLPCEIQSGKISQRDGIIEFSYTKWCYAFDIETKKCKIHETRPIACRITSCRFIREAAIGVNCIEDEK